MQSYWEELPDGSWTNSMGGRLILVEPGLWTDDQGRRVERVGNGFVVQEDLASSGDDQEYQPNEELGRVLDRMR